MSQYNSGLKELILAGVASLRNQLSLNKPAPFLFLSASLVLNACVSVPEQELAKYERSPESVLPPISIYRARPSATLTSTCEDYDAQSMLHHCNLNAIEHKFLRSAFQRTEAFESAGVNSKEHEYSLSYSTASFNHEGADELTQAVLAGASLMLLPIQTKGNIKTEVSLAWSGEVLKTYTYDFPIHQSVSLLNVGSEKGAEKHFDVLASHLVKDLQEDDAFSPKLISKTLKSSDYDLLEYPDSADGFHFRNRYDYRHPLQGVQLNYRSKDFEFDSIDVYVYPIRRAEWSDLETVLREEASYVQKEMQIAEKEGLYEIQGNTLVERLDWTTSAGQKGIKVSGLLKGNDGDLYQTSALIFISGDKFLKFRASFLATESIPNPEVFARAFIPAVHVPNESLFMAKLRKQYIERARTHQPTLSPKEK